MRRKSGEPAKTVCPSCSRRVEGMPVGTKIVCDKCGGPMGTLYHSAYEAELAEVRTALDSALRLAGVPEHAQDDEWRAEYDRLVAFERSMKPPSLGGKE